MPDSKQLREELDWVTAKLSSQTWILNLGLLGTTWSLIMSVHSQARLTFAEARPTLVACIIGLTFDVIQYLSAFWLISQTRKALRASGKNSIDYDVHSWPYILRRVSFVTKIVATLVAAVWLLVVLFRKLG
jgi:hypothetical protein